MITYNGTFAIDLSTVKSISMEYHDIGGNLVFVLNNLIIPFTDPETDETKLHSFSNQAVKYYYDNSDSLHAYFEEWVGWWKDSK